MDEKNISLYKMNCFPEPHVHGKNKMKLELDWAKLLKIAISLDTELANKTDLVSLKSDIDKLNIDK